MSSESECMLMNSTGALSFSSFFSSKGSPERSLICAHRLRQFDDESPSIREAERRIGITPLDVPRHYLIGNAGLFIEGGQHSIKNVGAPLQIHRQPIHQILHVPETDVFEVFVQRIAYSPQGRGLPV